MNDEVNEDEKFSEDPEEQLKIENEILKLKLQAELGGDFEGEEGLSPEIENTFLKNVLEFEHQYANAASKTLFEILNKPEFEKESKLNDNEVLLALRFMEELMEKNGIEVDYAAEYSPRIKYRFITEELFYNESPFMNVPGMTMHYIYEEFHPNHELDIKDNAEKFVRHWTERSFDENSFELASELIVENGAILSRDQLLEKMQIIFDAYVHFENVSFSIENISFELHETGKGLGFAEGSAAYDAILENGEIQNFQGAFKLYMQYDDWWNIFFFHWPGFKW